MEERALGRGGDTKVPAHGNSSCECRPQARAQRPKSLTQFIAGQEDVEKTLSSQTSIFPSPTFSVTDQVWDEQGDE